MRNHEDDEVAKIPVVDLVEPWIVLRPVRRDSVDYLELKEAIEREGLITPICVRPSANSLGKFEIIAGLYRHSIYVELDRKTIPCLIKHGVTDDDVLTLQVQENAVRPKTTPSEFARRLKRIFELHPDMTIAELSRRTGKRPGWVKAQLTLLDLSKEVQLMVDRGEMPVGNAYMLAKINPRSTRDEYTYHAKALPPKQFKALAAGLIKRFAECVHQGKMDERYLVQHEPHGNLRSIDEIENELKSPKVGALILVTEGCETALDGWNLALKWVIHMDRQGIAEQMAELNFIERQRLEREARHVKSLD